MRDEKSVWIVKLTALAVLAFLGFFIYNAAIDSRPGAKLSDTNIVKTRVSDRYLNKNVIDEDAKYEWGGKAENTAANIVTSIVVEYRLFDTTLEVIVLFVTILAFGFVIPKNKGIVKPAGGIIGPWAPMLMVFMLLIGGYMFINGHLSPGGGFPAGAIMSTAVLIGVLSGKRTIGHNALKIMESIAGAAIFLLGIISYYITGNFFQNFLTVGGIGDLFSAGLMPVFYTLIAFKVGSELSNIYFAFYEEGSR